jgi:putative addiction module CopG family antidote
MFERLAEVDRTFIKSQVAEGFYTSEIEVVRDALRRMRQEQAQAARFQAAVMEGERAIQEGRTAPLTPELMQRLIEEGISRAKAGKPYFSQDAIPQ